MRPAFDPYHKWLGIPREQQPPDYYRLLAIQPFESDPDVIQAAADQRMAHLRNYQTGPHSDFSQRLLNEVASARVCLLNEAKKAAYDERLRAELQEKLEAAQEEYPLAVPVAPAADLLDGLPYGRPPRVSARKSSAKFGNRLPIMAAIAGLSIVGLLLIGVTHWNRIVALLDQSAVAVKPRNVPAKHTAKITEPGDKTGEKQPTRADQTPDKERPAEMSESSSSVAKPTQAAPSSPPPSPIEPSQTKPSATPEGDSKPPPAAEWTSSDQSASMIRPPISELPDSKARTPPPPPDNVPPLSSSPAEQKSAERTSAALAGTTPRPRVRFGRWFDLLTSRNELTDWELDNCHYHYADRIVELDDGYMFCPIVAKDAMIHAAVRRSGAGAHVYLLLRNSDEGCYAAGLEDHAVKIYHLKQFPGADKKLPLPMRRTQETLGEFTLPQGKADTATAVFVFGFSAVGEVLAAYVNADLPVLAVKDKHLSDGTVGIGVRNNARAYFTDVELKIPNKMAFVADLRPPPSPAKPNAPSESKVPPAK
jgi:hypothetical protein